jgi:hypothetical protein
VVLADLLAEAPCDSADVFAEFQRIRQPNANAIATMALENYIEMRDSVADPHYLAKRELGALLAERAPEHYMARYRMVTFTHLPYAYALERGRAQDALLEQLLHNSTSRQTSISMQRSALLKSDACRHYLHFVMIETLLQAYGETDYLGGAANAAAWACIRIDQRFRSLCSWSAHALGIHHGMESSLESAAIG